MQPQAPPSYTASPLGSFPELAQAYATSFSSPVSNARLNVENQQDQTAVANAKVAQAEAEKRAAAFSDAKNYTVQQRSDGGFGFYGPDGKEVSAAQYANNTGQKLTDVLKDSQNPIDVRYIQDQQNLTKYLQAKSQSKFDPKQAAIAKQIENEVSSVHKINLAQANPQQLIQAMQQNYPSIYGAHQDNSPGFSGASTFLPNAGGAQSQAEANNPLGFYQPQGSGGSGLGGLGSKKPQPKQSLLSRVEHRIF
jgi:hypothetical protein